MQAIYARREYTNLPYGHYTFRVRTRTLTGNEGEELSYEFFILKPWYATILAFFGFTIIIFLIVVAIIKAYTKKLKNENIRLEGIVAERTAVVVKQKEELESSIHYASRIQMALLPTENILAENIPEYFILFKPRDIVSGDFYWMARKKDRLYVVVADCTGHGVPGAFMSLLGMSFLDEILDRDTELRADLVLSEMRQHVTDSLKQTGIENESKDGMDLGLLVFDFTHQHVEFSGAYNPCYKVRKLRPDENRTAGDESDSGDGSLSDGVFLLETLRASKMPIGISSKMDQGYVFEKFPIEKGVFLLSLI
ncbi:MAG: SpoIIE family protein phosphatase [Bacteroidetes bacterium]|nr:SpoIIE family protein phosphatase [Bacteroidota bacterium]